MIALVDLQLHQELLYTAKLNWTDLTCDIQLPSLKNIVEKQLAVVGGKFRGHSQTPL